MYFYYLALSVDLSKVDQPSWDVLKEVIQCQRFIAEFGIGVLIALTLGILGFSWFKHWRGMDKLRKDMEKELASLEDRYTEKVQDFEQKLEGEIKRLETKMDKEIKESKIVFEADKARLFGIAAQQSDLPSIAIMWWSRAFFSYVTMGETEKELQKVAIEAIIRTLPKLPKGAKFEEKDLEELLDNISVAPPYLQTQKRQIEEKLLDLQRKKD